MKTNPNPRIKFCPRCKSPSVQKEMTLKIIIGAPQQWKCNNCDFKGHLFPEIEKDKLKEIQKIDKNSADTNHIK